MLILAKQQGILPSTLCVLIIQLIRLFKSIHTVTRMKYSIHIVIRFIESIRFLNRLFQSIHTVIRMEYSILLIFD